MTDSNNIGVEGAIALANSLIELDLLEKLSLSMFSDYLLLTLDENNIGSEGAKAISKSLKCLYSISELYFRMIFSTNK